MKIAICSLSEYTHIAEVVDAAEHLSQSHDVCYFIGFSTRAAENLLSARGVSYKVLLDPATDIQSTLASAANFKSAEKLFESYFFKHTEMVLPKLIEALDSWQPDVVLSNIRDYAGLTAAEILNKPVATFGLTSPLRDRQFDPPFFSGVSRDCPSRMRQLMWKFHDNFHQKMDAIYNEIIRHPYSLPDISDVSTLHSKQLVFLWSIASLSNKYSADPSYVKYVGPLSTKKSIAIRPDEQKIIDQLESSKHPRVFITLGTYHSANLLLPVMTSLQHYSGTIVISTGNSPDGELMPYLANKKVVWKPFFFAMNEILECVDVVVNVASGKSTLDALSFGKPLVCLPQQGEQYEMAHRLQDLGAGIMPCLRKWDSAMFVDAIEHVSNSDKYHNSALQLKAEIDSQGGVAQVSNLLENLAKESICN